MLFERNQLQCYLDENRVSVCVSYKLIITDRLWKQPKVANSSYILDTNLRLTLFCALLFRGLSFLFYLLLSCFYFVDDEIKIVRSILFSSASNKTNKFRLLLILLRSLLFGDRCVLFLFVVAIVVRLFGLMFSVILWSLLGCLSVFCDLWFVFVNSVCFQFFCLVICFH